MEPISNTTAHRIFIECWDSVSDDGTPEEGWTPPPGIYLGGFDDSGQLVGVFAFLPVSTATVDSHVAMRKSGYGNAAKTLGRMAIAWIWRNTNFKRIITQTPGSNPLAVRYVGSLGFVRFGVNPSSWLKNGKYHDMYLSGITRGE